MDSEPVGWNIYRNGNVGKSQFSSHRSLQNLKKLAWKVGYIVKKKIQSLKGLISVLQQSWWLSFLDYLVDRIEMEELDKKKEDEEDKGKKQNSKCH